MEAVVVVVVFVASIEDDDDVDTGNVDVVKVVGVPGGVNVSVVVKSIYVINDDNVVFRDVDCSDVRGGVSDPGVVFEDCDGCKVDGVLGVLEDCDGCKVDGVVGALRIVMVVKLMVC